MQLGTGDSIRRQRQKGQHCKPYAMRWHLILSLESISKLGVDVAR